MLNITNLVTIESLRRMQRSMVKNLEDTKIVVTYKNFMKTITGYDLLRNNMKTIELLAILQKDLG